MNEIIGEESDGLKNKLRARELAVGCLFEHLFDYLCLVAVKLAVVFLQGLSDIEKHLGERLLEHLFLSRAFVDHFKNIYCNGLGG